MKKVLLLASAVCLAATTAFAHEFNPYIGAKAKYALSRNEVKVTGVYEGKNKFNDEVFGGTLVVGNIYKVMDGDFRVELEYTKNADAKAKGRKIKTQGALFNVYYDFNLKSTIPVKPYVGLGLGWGQAELIGAGKVKDDGLSAQIGGGINYRVADHVVLDLGYRYISYGDFEKEYRIPGVLYEKYEYEPHAHEFLLGARYEF